MASRYFLSAVGNLLQNAFKFTHPGSDVLLKVYSMGDRVLIEVEDNAAACRRETWKRCSCRSPRAARIEPVSGWGFRSLAAASRPMLEPSGCATSRLPDAFLPSTCRATACRGRRPSRVRVTSTTPTLDSVIFPEGSAQCREGRAHAPSSLLLSEGHP